MRKATRSQPAGSYYQLTLGGIGPTRIPDGCILVIEEAHVEAAEARVLEGDIQILLREFTLCTGTPVAVKVATHDYFMSHTEYSVACRSVGRARRQRWLARLRRAKRAQCRKNHAQSHLDAGTPKHDIEPIPPLAEAEAAESLRVMLAAERERLGTDQVGAAEAGTGLGAGS